MIPASKRLDKVLEVARDWRVQGVISSIIRFCILYVSDVPVLKDKLAQEGIPLLELNIEYNEGATGQLRTRVGAFLEMLASEGVKVDRGRILRAGRTHHEEGGQKGKDTGNHRDSRRRLEMAIRKIKKGVPVGDVTSLFRAT